MFMYTKEWLTWDLNPLFGYSGLFHFCKNQTFIHDKLYGFSAGVQEMLNTLPIRSHAVYSQFLLRPGSTSSHSVPGSRQSTEESGSISFFSRHSGSTMLMPYVLERGPRYAQ
jgi:hypothetical protein